MKDLKYLLAYFLPLSAILGIYFGGIWSASALYVGFILIPVFELVLPTSTYNLDAAAEDERSRQLFFDILLYLNVPILYGCMWFFLETVSSNSLSNWEIVGMTISIGVLAGSIGINVAHELGHRHHWFDQLMASMLLLPALYMHFTIEHNHGHHKHVATDKDPVSARKGEALYAFWLRAVSGVYINAWRIQAQQLQRKGENWFSLSNKVLIYQFIQLAWLLAIGLLYGWWVMGLAIVAAIIGFLQLETVNYIEHYGLRRQQLPNGRYENVRPVHSWNSNHELGRIFLYELTRHSDHHFKANRKYQVLRHFDESPQLPAGYPSCMLMSFVPPLWFRVMNRRLERFTVPADPGQ
ncbi:MAG: alkane 1-monooxygenase [Bacteroidota bacterium]